MAPAKIGDKVKVHYTGTLEDGSVFDSSRNRDEPLEFELGSGAVLAGFDQAVQGLEVGDSKTTNITADQAYGLHRDDMVVQVDRKEVPADMELNPGDRIAINTQSGKRVPVTIVEITEQELKLDLNHFLAGKDLTFDIELLAIV